MSGPARGLSVRIAVTVLKSRNPGAVLGGIRTRRKPHPLRWWPGSSLSSSWPRIGDCSFMGTSSLCPGQLLALERPFNNLLVLS